MPWTHQQRAKDGVYLNRRHLWFFLVKIYLLQAPWQLFFLFICFSKTLFISTSHVISSYWDKRLTVGILRPSDKSLQNFSDHSKSHGVFYSRGQICLADMPINNFLNLIMDGNHYATLHDPNGCMAWGVGHEWACTYSIINCCTCRNLQALIIASNLLAQGTIKKDW